MGMTLVTVVSVMQGGAGGYYTHGRFGAACFSGVLGLLVFVLLTVWFFGSLDGLWIHQSAQGGDLKTYDVQ